MHFTRPFTLSSSKKQVFQLLRKVSSSGSSNDRKTLHILVDDDDNNSNNSTNNNSSISNNNSNNNNNNNNSSVATNSNIGLPSILLNNMSVIDALCLVGPSKAAEIAGIAPLFLKKGQGAILFQKKNLLQKKNKLRISIVCI
jgi:hypothetical protein